VEEVEAEVEAEVVEAEDGAVAVVERRVEEAGGVAVVLRTREAPMVVAVVGAVTMVLKLTKEKLMLVDMEPHGEAAPARGPPLEVFPSLEIITAGDIVEGTVSIMLGTIHMVTMAMGTTTIMGVDMAVMTILIMDINR